MRETREEIGVDLATARIVGNLPSLHPRSSGGTGIEVTPFVFVPSAPVIPQLGPEAVGIVLDAARARRVGRDRRDAPATAPR